MTVFFSSLFILMDKLCAVHFENVITHRRVDLIVLVCVSIHIGYNTLFPIHEWEQETYDNYKIRRM